jgi:ribosome maturation factor RimP
MGGIFQPIFFAGTHLTTAAEARRMRLAAQVLTTRLDERVMNWQRAVEGTVTGLGYELVDADKGAGGLLRVFIDHPASNPATAERSITVDDCEKVTRQLQHVLEVEGVAYARLVVSSPGLDRPLKTDADYARFAGAQIELTLKMPFQGRKKYRGVLQARAEGEGWRLVLSDAKAGLGDQALDFSLDEVREARLIPVVDFKGRRFAAPQEATAAASTGPDQELDGDRIQ